MEGVGQHLEVAMGELEAGGHLLSVLPEILVADYCLGEEEEVDNLE